MGVQNPNTTDYEHPDEPNLLNLHKAMQYNSSGEPVIRTAIDGDITIGEVIVDNVEISNDEGNPIPITGTVSVTGADFTFGGTSVDAFGRLRISDALTLFDTRTMYYDHDQFASNLVASGNVVYNANSSSYLMSVTGAGDAVYRETYKTFSYQPGKSLLVLNTFCGNTPTNGITQRIGYFNDENGIFFEIDGETLNMVIRSSSSGSITHERVAQSAWNADRLTGLADDNNPSGISINPALSQIFWMDIEWLGVGSVRTGFVINGQFIHCHTFHHANQIGNTTTYMGTANLPCRYELISTGPAATMRQICTTVISEGGYEMSGRVSSIGHGFATEVSLPNDDSFIPLLSIRLKSTMPDAIVIPKNFSISVGSNDLYIWRVYRRAITSGGSWTSGGIHTAVEYNLAPTTLISGDRIDEGFIQSSNQSSGSLSNEDLAFENQLFRDPFTNTRYEFVLMCATNGTNVTALAAVQWQDIS